MFSLSRASEEALAEFCEGLPDKQATYVRECVRRVCEDPSGRREPKHRYTRPFSSAGRYTALARGETVWEFKTNHCRGLFLVDADVRVIVFLPIAGRRFMRPSECPWH